MIIFQSQNFSTLMCYPYYTKLQYNTGLFLLLIGDENGLCLANRGWWCRRRGGA